MVDRAPGTSRTLPDGVTLQPTTIDQLSDSRTSHTLDVCRKIEHRHEEVLVVRDDAAHRFLIAAARSAFLEGSDPRLRGVPDHVAASWRRSVLRGVQPSAVAGGYTPALDLESRLVRCTRPVMDQLVEQMADVGVCVALTDNRARLLARKDTSSRVGRMLDRVHFAQGFDFAEGEMGTNGVGTVLEFGESVHIVGSEHFVDTLQSFACAGAPVRDPFTGRIEGVLDISCVADHSTPLMHSLVRSAARRIERKLLLDRNQAQQALFHAYTRADARTREAVLAVGQRVTIANSAMQTMLDPADQEVLLDHARFVMHRRDAVDDCVGLPSGCLVRLRGAVVSVGFDIAGLVAVVTVVREPGGDVVRDGGRAAVRLVGGSGPAPVVAAEPGRRQVGSSCAAWRDAAATVAVGLLAREPVVVLGESGTGRLTLLTDLAGTQGDPRRVVVVEAAEAEAGPHAVAARLGRPDLGVLVVLRDIDRLSGPVVELLVAALPDVPGRRCSVAATATEAGGPGCVHAPLLSVFRVSATLPPLRYRRADIAGLATVLLAELAPHRDVQLSTEALRVLGRYRWPGNVAQLSGALAEALSRRPVGCIETADLPAYCHTAPRTSLRPIEEIERDAIVVALRETGGNRVVAAAALGIARSTLYRKIRHYGITA